MEESPEPAPANPMDRTPGAVAGHLFIEVTLGLSGPLTPKQPWLILTGETHCQSSSSARKSV
jgi:hypothetical protein